MPGQLRMTHSRRPGQSGFSMIEVLVTVVVISIALLGVAKMQAAAVSNTQVARVRSLVALQAGSLAAAMRGNPAFWQATTAVSFTASGETISGAGVLSATPPVCKNAVCTPAQMAAYDVQEWAKNLNTQMPTYDATVTCQSAATPVTCSIKMSWLEKYVAINVSTATGMQSERPTYTLYVTP